MQRYFQISVHALIITAFIALALTGRLDLISIVFFMLGWSYSAYRSAKAMPPLISSRDAFVLSCGYILFFFIDGTIFSRSFIPATIHLVLLLELAKLFERKSDRDYFYLIVLSFLKVLAASALTIDISFVVTLLLFLIAFVSTLMSFDMYRSWRNSNSAVDRIDGPLGAMSVWATLCVVAIGVALFFIIPRIGTGYFSRADAPGLVLSGFTENVQLGEIGQVKLSSAVVMRAKLKNGTPYAILKWRGISLDTFDGKSWYRTDRKRQPAPILGNGQFLVHPNDRSGEKVQYEILLEPLATTALFAPFRPRLISGPLQEVEIDDDDSLHSRLPSARRIRYDVVSEVPTRTGQFFLPSETARQVPLDVQRRYLQLPPDLDTRIRDLALKITAMGTSTVHKASLVETYLRRNYKYSLNLTWDPGEQPVSTFLFTAKQGHCEYFASSMAILLRAAGIPTRLVNGFLMGEYNPVGEDYIVRQSDAHSWVEIYEPERGWLEFDPTPQDPNARELTLSVQLGQYLDAMELFWNSYILVYDSSLQVQLFRSAQEQAQFMQAAFREKSNLWIGRGQAFSDRLATRLRVIVETPWFWIIVALLSAPAAIIRHRRSITTRIQIWRLTRGIGTVNEDVVEQMFYRAAHIAQQIGGVPRRPAETWREWIIGLPDPAQRTRLLSALSIFERSKYGRMPVSTAEFTLLQNTIRELKA
jgi:transglutaminase-like putative cysteine protease